MIYTIDEKMKSTFMKKIIRIVKEKRISSRSYMEYSKLFLKKKVFNIPKNFYK